MGQCNALQVEILRMENNQLFIVLSQTLILRFQKNILMTCYVEWPSDLIVQGVMIISFEFIASWTYDLELKKMCLLKCGVKKKY